jgi:peptide/nickel transport system substrate-binding protein
VRRAPALALALLFGVACQVPPATATPAPTGAQIGGTLRVALPAEVTSFDTWNGDPASLIASRQMFETLVEVDPATSRIMPALASSWQMTNDGASWTFTLREGVRFHDGTPLDATAVVASFERGRASRVPAYRALFDDPSAIVSVQAVDPRTVRFDLRAPFGPFLAHLGSPQVLSRPLPPRSRQTGRSHFAGTTRTGVATPRARSFRTSTASSCGRCAMRRRGWRSFERGAWR